MPTRNRLLLILVGLIWLVVGLRYLGSWDWGEEAADPAQIIVREWDSLPLSQSEVKLLLDYRDPFLPMGGSKPKRETRSNVATRQVGQIRRVSANRTPPPFEYLGWVEGGSQQAPTGIARWQGKTLTIVTGDSLGPLWVDKIGPAGAHVRWQDTTWFIGLKR